MGLESYYRDHWVEIEEDRLDRCKQMFWWGPTFERYLTPADIKPSQIVGDLGCGPGFLSCELLRKFAPNGRVHSFNLNKDFSEDTHAKAKGLGDCLELHHLTSETLSISDASLDRIIAKNVMVYADDPAHTFREFRRVLKPSGKANAIDRDFAMVAIDP
ncbi:MAG: methyltransferase domain-containing protein, partial [Alphaproteobacteria bacterium]|nr:methyltransferase domain-containing protein [Alphaproteobacteria bacterium]